MREADESAANTSAACESALGSEFFLFRTVFPFFRPGQTDGPAGRMLPVICGIVPFHSYGLAGDFHPGAVRHRECVFRDAREYGPLLPLQYDITRKIPRQGRGGQALVFCFSWKNICLPSQTFGILW